MPFRKLRGAVLVGGVAIILAGLVSPAEAGCLDWLFPCNQTAVTTYSAPFVAPAVASCDPCASPCASPCGPQTCAYTPVTTYRWTYSRVPYTSYRPVSVVDPCSGCVRTSYRPVSTLSLLPWLHREPVTSYRAACYTPAPACGSCGVSTFAPAALAVPSSCSSCTSAAPVSSITVPGVAVPGVAVPSVTTSAASTPPTLNSTYPAQSTFLPGPSAGTTDPAPGVTNPSAPAGAIQATPDPIGNPGSVSPPATSPNPASAQPGLLFPAEGRTTVRPIQPVRPTTGFRTVSFVAPAPTHEHALDVGGWHAVK